MKKKKQFQLNLTQEQKEKFKESLRQRRNQLPFILNQLQSHKNLLTVLCAEPDELLCNVPLHDIIQYHTINCPEITSQIMILPCLEINNAILENNQTISTAQRAVLEAQQNRLQLLNEDAKNGETVIHSFTEIVDNLQTIDKTYTRKLVEILKKVNQHAILNTENTIQNYNKLTL